MRGACDLLVRKQVLQEPLVLLKTQQTAAQKPLDIMLQFGLGLVRQCGKSQGTSRRRCPEWH